jgi:endoglucanase
MDRVQEVVNYVIDNDMYCILNIHHDNHIANYPYFYPDNSHYQQSEKFVTSVWEQVSERFEAYDNHLIFETLNEPRLTNHPDEWWIDPNNISNDVKDAMNNINKLNAAALNTIRQSGGNNAKRFVMMPTYGASADGPNLNGCVMPNDDHIIAEIHAYRPYYFALAPDDEPQMTTQFDPAGNGGDIVNFLNDVKRKFIDNGIPVIIDEMAATNRNNLSERVEWAKYYTETASKYGIPCVWWDNNAFGVGNENLGLIDRSNNQVRYPEIMEALLEGTKTRG